MVATIIYTTTRSGFYSVKSTITNVSYVYENDDEDIYHEDVLTVSNSEVCMTDYKIVKCDDLPNYELLNQALKSNELTFDNGVKKSISEINEVYYIKGFDVYCSLNYINVNCNDLPNYKLIKKNLKITHDFRKRDSYIKPVV